MIDSIVVQSVPWKVERCPANSPLIDERYGKTSFDTHTIYLCSDMPQAEELETLLHEICHTLINGLEEANIQKEDMLRTFSVMLADTLIRNRISFDI